jgi:hypothetical protein
MNRFFVTALTLGGLCAGTVAQAASGDDVLARLAALEQENAAIRKENAALRENKALRARNATLKSSAAAAPMQAGAQPARDPFGAYAADLPLAYKAPVIAQAGQFRIWGEGGAIWSGGDPVDAYYAPLISFIAGGSALPGANLTPKVGWEAATGFDYRFADSLWHVGGQFRYGEGRNSFALNETLAIGPGQFGNNATSSFLLTQANSASTRETHWLADLAVGRDVLGQGKDAMQLKFGVRMVEFDASLSQPSSVTQSVTYNPPRNNGTATVFNSLSSTLQQQSSFFGVGPRVGVEGAVPLQGGWSLDYLGDAAVLFGNRKFTQSTDGIVTGFTNGVQTLLQPVGLLSAPDRTFATVFNADIQVGVSYWLTQNVKVSASYRLDAYFGAISATDSQQDPTKLHAVDRYIHGPHLGVSATF